MDAIRQVSKDAYPTVILTLVSMIEAIALERLVDAALSIELRDLSSAGLLDLLQVVFVFGTILHLFITFALATLVYRLALSVQDCFLPFFAGVLQFLLIAFAVGRPDALWFGLSSFLLTVAIAGTVPLLRRVETGDDDLGLAPSMPRLRRALVPPRGGGDLSCAPSPRHRGHRGWGRVLGPNVDGSHRRRAR